MSYCLSSGLDIPVSPCSPPSVLFVQPADVFILQGTEQATLTKSTKNVPQVCRNRKWKQWRCHTHFIFTILSHVIWVVNFPGCKFIFYWSRESGSFSTRPPVDWRRSAQDTHTNHQLCQQIVVLNPLNTPMLPEFSSLISNHFISKQLIYLRQNITFIAAVILLSLFSLSAKATDEILRAWINMDFNSSVMNEGFKQLNRFFFWYGNLGIWNITCCQAV